MLNSIPLPISGARRVFKTSALAAFLLLSAASTAWGDIGLDAVASGDSSSPAGSIVTSVFSTTAVNELLLAFVSSDSNSPGVAVTQVTGAGLAWQLVRRSNAQPGTAEIWRAFATGKLTNAAVTATLSQRVAASITVMSFAGVDSSMPIGNSAAQSAPSGAPSASLVTSRVGSWVLGVGTDWDNAIPRQPGPNQTIVHQFLPTVNDTYWVQRQSAPASAAGQQVTINDTQPTTDRYDLSIVEMLPATTFGGGTFAISGALMPASVGAGATVTVSQGALTLASASADANGLYSVGGLANGTYTVTPTGAGRTFAPASESVAIAGANQSGVNFTAQYVANYPDLSVIVPTTAMSIVGTDPNRVFQYTHDTFNGGSGPLDIQPVYNAASGNYQGYQNVYSFQSGSWVLISSTPIAGAFVFDAAHGHFHFPFAKFGLYQSNPGGSIGSAVALSPKVGFCIGDSFIYDPSLPNAGAFGNWGSCANPTSVRGLSIGAVDEYDQTDPGQSIPLPAGMPDGTYWLRAIADPDGYLQESNESNNETDVQLSIVGNTVTVLKTAVPVLPAAPAVSMTSPADGSTATGTVQLMASTTSNGVTGVQFLVDGLPFGNPVSTPPYSLPLNTSTLQNGSHWLAAQATNSAAQIGTSSVTFLTVNNTTTAPPTVQITGPAPGAMVSAVITIGATAAAQTGQPSVQFYVDNTAIGAPVTAPPYLTTWNTNGYSSGSHTITARATDQFGSSTLSAPVTVLVDNSHPPNTLRIDAKISSDGMGVLTTSAFSTSAAAGLLVAFVSYDGPLGSSQSASVSGAGLTWYLAKRSNAQAGVAEIWYAVPPPATPMSNVTVSAQSTYSGYDGSLTVIAFANASGPGTVGQASAPTGLPSIYIPGVTAGDWVFAVGNDWDNAIPRVPVNGQLLVHQKLDTQVGDTYWVQSTATPTAMNALVTISDSSPSKDQWNYAAIEIVATRQ